MSTADEDGRSDVFVRDLLTNTTLYASRASGIDGDKGDDGARAASISGDGRFVAFQSTSDSLSDEDDDAYTNIFVRDLQTHTTIHASRTGDGTAADGESSSASISADGRFVAFESGADNLSGEDSDGVFDVFVRDLQNGVTTYASRAARRVGRRRLLQPVDLRRRPLRRVRLRGHQSERRGRRSGPGRLRARPACEHDHARQPRRRCDGRTGRWQRRRVRDLRRRPLRRLLVAGGQPQR